jgi:hypothetical protein
MLYYIVYCRVNEVYLVYGLIWACSVCPQVSGCTLLAKLMRS